MDKHVEIHRDGTLATHPPYLGDDENLLHDSGVDQVSKVKDVAQLSSFLTHWLKGLSNYIVYSAQKEIIIWFKFQIFLSVFYISHIYVPSRHMKCRLRWTESCDNAKIEF